MGIIGAPKVRPDNKYTFSMKIGGQSGAFPKQEKFLVSFVFVILTEVIFEKGYYRQI